MMKRREFLVSVEQAAVAAVGSASLLPANDSVASAAKDNGPSNGAVPGTKGYSFKLGMYLPELDLPFDTALEKAKELGAEHVWFNRLLGEPDIAQMSDAEVDRMAERVARHDLKIFLLNAGNPFKDVHLEDLDRKTMEQHPAFRKDFAALVRSMEIAARLKVPAVGAFTFAWPGEYKAGKPTWPMRWLTRGGVIADVDLDKLVKAFSLVAEQAERHGVNFANLKAMIRKVEAAG